MQTALFLFSVQYLLLPWLSSTSISYRQEHVLWSAIAVPLPQVELFSRY